MQKFSTNLANQIQEHIQRIVHHPPSKICPWDASMAQHKNISVIYNITKMKEKVACSYQ